MGIHTCIIIGLCIQIFTCTYLDICVAFIEPISEQKMVRLWGPCFQTSAIDDLYLSGKLSASNHVEGIYMKLNAACMLWFCIHAPVHHHVCHVIQVGFLVSSYRLAYELCSVG